MSAKKNSFRCSALGNAWETPVVPTMLLVAMLALLLQATHASASPVRACLTLTNNTQKVVAPSVCRDLSRR